MGQRLEGLTSPAEEKYRERIASARVVHSVFVQVRDAMRARAPWLHDREQVAAVFNSVIRWGPAGAPLPD